MTAHRLNTTTSSDAAIYNNDERPLTRKQQVAIYAASHRRGLDRVQLLRLIETHTGKSGGTSNLSRQEASAVLSELLDPPAPVADPEQVAATTTTTEEHSEVHDAQSP